MIKLYRKISSKFLYYIQLYKLSTSKGIECTIVNGDTEFKIIANSKIELYNRARDYSFEKTTMEWICNYIKNGETVYDVGANIGIYSLLIARKYPDSKIIAFEPEAGNFFKLNKNILLNGIKNVMPYSIGLSDKTGFSKLFVSSLEFGSSCHSLDAPFSDGAEFVPLNEQGVAAFRLDDFISAGEFPLPNHIKIDVDGFELNVLRGGNKIFGNPVLKSMIVEISNPELKIDTEKFIMDLGFVEKMRESWNNSKGEVFNILYSRY